MKKEIAILLPKLGESVAEATLLSWCKKEGDVVNRDEIICEIGTDKVETELPSEYSGVIKKLLYQENDRIPVGAPILLLLTEDEGITDDSSTKINDFQQETNSPAQANITITSKENNLPESVGYISPVVREMIVNHKLSLKDIQTIKGSGNNGRITKKDVQLWLANQKLTGNQQKQINLQINPEDKVVSLSRMRKLIADNLLSSYQHIPHVTTFKEIDVSQMVALREQNKSTFLAKTSQKLTYTHILMKAVIEQLETYPQLNSWLSNDEWILKKDINLAFAIAVEKDQLIVPNIKQAQNLNLHELIMQVNEINRKAKTKRLETKDLQQSTFTISNTGIYGSTMGTPIISSPQVAVLALGEISRKPVVKIIDGKEKIIPASMMFASLSYDHRVIDGKLASEFLSSLSHQLETISTIKI